MFYRRFRRWLAVLAMLTASSAAAQQAQTQVCATLSAQLAAIDRNFGGQNQALANQYQSQRAALQAVQGRVAQQGCNVLFRLFAPPHCGPILQQLDQLRASVNQLEAALRSGNAGGNAAQRNGLIRAMQMNGCSFQPQQPREATFRTLCVRTCDGYYFPISFATTREHFRDDLAACQAQCPGQEVDLYVHRNPGETIEAAENIDGTPYADLVNAFAFRQAYNSDCRCGAPTVQVAAAGGPFTPLPATATDRLADLRAAVPTPVPRPEPTEDPETLANRAGGLTLPYDPFAVAPGVELVVDGIRFVGPTYYYALR
jgi:hypothetical protein